MNTNVKAIIIASALAALWCVAVARADDAPVIVTTDKATVVNCQYVGRVDAPIGFFTVGIKLDAMKQANARKIGADTVLTRGRFDLQGEGFKCAK